MPDKDSRIHIDEDWKAQVEREREQARQKVQAPEVPEAPEAEQDGKEPPLTLFDMLTSTLAAQTMMALGLAVPEGQEQVIVDLAYAAHLIDTLAMLREKTQGNLEPGELDNLNEAVSELERVFAIRAEQVREMQMKQPTEPGIDPNPPFLRPS